MKTLKKIVSIVAFLAFGFTCLAQKPEEVNPNGFNKFYFSNGKLSSEVIW
ncbi:MAG: hypothetical protein IPP71_07270 [Bacteroidetes bacterium]|nr:hypothetical protein [Bacteroidota bacterium]